MELHKIKSKKDIKKQMKEYGNSVIVLFGSYYGLRVVNIDYDLW